MVHGVTRRGRRQDSSCRTKVCATRRVDRNLLELNETIQLTAATVEITKLTPDSQPAEVRFRFPASLEGPSLCWLQVPRQGCRPLHPPTVGETVKVDRFRQGLDSLSSRKAKTRSSTRLIVSMDEAHFQKDMTFRCAFGSVINGSFLGVSHAPRVVEAHTGPRKCGGVSHLVLRTQVANSRRCAPPTFMLSST